MYNLVISILYVFKLNF